VQRGIEDLLVVLDGHGPLDLLLGVPNGVL
jgi:hypothetical protein